MDVNMGRRCRGHDVEMLGQRTFTLTPQAGGGVGCRHRSIVTGIVTASHPRAVAITVRYTAAESLWCTEMHLVCQLHFHLSVGSSGS